MKNGKKYFCMSFHLAVVRASGLHTAAQGSNVVLISGMDLFRVDPGSTLPRLLNSLLIASYGYPSPPEFKLVVLKSNPSIQAFSLAI